MFEIFKGFSLYLVLVISFLVVVAGTFSDRNSQKKELIMRSFSVTYNCDNLVTEKDWARIADPQIIKFHDQRFYNVITKLNNQYGYSCFEDSKNECFRNVVSYIVDNSYRLRSLVQSECVNPFVSVQARNLANTEVKSTQSSFVVLVSRFSISTMFNLELATNFLNSLIERWADAKTNYNRTLVINYLRYDLKGKEWGIHLFKSPWGNVTDFNQPLRADEVIGNLTKFKVDLRKFRGSRDVNFVVHNGYEKDMFGLDMHWEISDNSEIWIVQGQAKVFTSKESAERFFKSGSDGKFSVFFYKEDQDYNGWALHIWNTEYDRSYTDWDSSMAGELDNGYLRFDVTPKVIGMAKKIGLVIHKRGQKSGDDFKWTVKPNTNLLHIYGRGTFVEKPRR